VGAKQETKITEAEKALGLADQAITTVGKALMAIKECQAIYPETDTTHVQKAADALLRTIEFVTTSVTPVFPKPASAPALDASPPNGAPYIPPPPATPSLTENVTQ
jgi:hypothetical protein